MRLLRLRPLAATLAALAACTAHAAAPSPLPPAPPAPPGEALRLERPEAAAAMRAWARDVEQHARMLVAQAGAPFVFEGDGATLAFVTGEMGTTREIVKNAPYTAEAVSETVQVLADGNRIVRTSTTLLARDAQGRTRQERKDARGSAVYIHDPVEGRSYALDPERRAVLRLPRVPLPPVPPLPPAALPAPPGPPAPPAAARVDTGQGHVVVSRADAGRDVRVEVVRIARGEGVPGTPPSLLALPALPRGPGETKQLGSRDFDGVRAEGTQTTHTIAAGAIGNEKPIVVTSERWFAPDLHVVVYARTTDPRAGETSYRLRNLKREEPPAEWFRVPADYRGGERR